MYLVKFDHIREDYTILYICEEKLSFFKYIYLHEHFSELLMNY